MRPAHQTSQQSQTEPKSAFRVEVLDGRAGFAEIEDAWRALALRANRPSVFASPDYFRIWRDVLSGGVSTVLITVWRGGALVGLMPLMSCRIRRGPLCVPRHDFAPSDRQYFTSLRPRPIRLRQLSTVASMPATYVGPTPLCRAEDLSSVTLASAKAVAGLRDWDVLALPAFEGAEEAAWLAALADAGLRPWVHSLGRQIQGVANVRPFAEIVAGQNKKFRQNIRRAEAEAERQGLSFEVLVGQDKVQERLPALAEIARQSWKQPDSRKADLIIPYEGEQKCFFETFLAGLTDRDGPLPVLSVGTASGEPIAAMLSLSYGDTLSTLILFVSGKVPKASPGMLLVGRTLDWSYANGISFLDLNATHEWVRHLVDDKRSQNIVISFAPTWRGRVYASISALARRLR